MLVLITHKGVSSGILKATELYQESRNAAPPTVARKSKTVSSVTVNMRGKYNPQPFGEVSSLILAADLRESEGSKDSEIRADDEDMQPLSNSLISSKFKKGLSMSFIARLSKTLIWVPLGGVSCVRKARNQHLARREDENGPPFPSSEIWIMSVVVEWASSSEMLISNSSNVLPGLRRLSDVLLDRSQGVRNSQPQKVLVSPSGLVALYCGLVNTSEEDQDATVEASRRRSSNDMTISDAVLAEKKRSIVTSLAQQSITLSDEEKWVRLQNYNSLHAISKHELGDSKSFSTFLWPASLCFCIAESFPHEERFVASGQDSLTDPLLDAQNWFMRKGARTEAMEVIRKLKEAEAEKRVEEQQRARQDALTDLLPRSTQSGSTQDIASIYPTPPDGLPSQAVSNMTQRPTPASYGEGIGKGQLDGVDADPHLVGSPLALNLAPVISSTAYDQLEDDLYADVDTDMFAANDLTEADLDFFDEPTAENNFVLRKDHDARPAGTFSEKIEVLGSRLKSGILDDIIYENDVGLTIKEDSIKQEMLGIGTLIFTFLNNTLTQVPRRKTSARCSKMQYIRKSTSFARCL